MIRKSKKFIIGLCWLLGLISIILATINLSLKLPSLENSINENNRKIELDLTTDALLKNEIDFIVLDNGMLSLMNKLNITEEDRELIYNRLTTNLQQILGYIEILGSGKIPTDEQINRWQNMDLYQLNDEASQSIEEMIGNRKINELYKERNELSKEKSNLIFWTILFQIGGLVLTQLGTFLEFVWKD